MLQGLDFEEEINLKAFQKDTLRYQVKQKSFEDKKAHLRAKMEVERDSRLGPGEKINQELELLSLVEEKVGQRLSPGDPNGFGLKDLRAKLVAADRALKL